MVVHPALWILAGYLTFRLLKRNDPPGPVQPPWGPDEPPIPPAPVPPPVTPPPIGPGPVTPPPQPPPTPAPPRPSGAPYKYNPNEKAMARAYVADVSTSPGDTWEQKVAPCSGALDILRATAGAPPVRRCFRDKNPNQSVVSWMTNMVYWAAYPLGPISIAPSQHDYIKAWKRIRMYVQDEMYRPAPFT